jgi:hypothetical protein
MKTPWWRSPWPVARVHLQQVLHQQLRLHQLYLDRHDYSGGDALDALARRKWSQVSGPDRRNNLLT